MTDVKKSILKEALSDYNTIMEAAKAKAKNDLVNEFPEKFDNLLKEQLNNKKKAVKESYKKIDITDESNKLEESNTNSEPVMEKTKKETTKKVVNEGFNQPFDKTAPKAQNDTYDISELDMSSVGSALEGADGADEVITMNEIEQELKGLDHKESPSVIDKSIEDGTSYGKLVGLKKQLDEVIEAMGGKDFNINKIAEDIADGHVLATNATPTTVAKVSTDKAIMGEADEAVSDDEIESVLNGDKNNDTDEAPVDEAHGVTYSSRRATMAGKHLPGADYLSTGELDQAPQRMQENKAKISGLIKENASLTKKLNEAKKYKDTVSGLLENYKNAVGKYRTQLVEMSIFNTNLAYANNLLVNEELALTQDDKVKIISEFKNVNSIAASGVVYKKFLTEMKESKKTLDESIEEKASVSINQSSKQKLDEVVEKVAYSDNAHIEKMLKNIRYAENRGKK